MPDDEFRHELGQVLDLLARAMGEADREWRDQAIANRARGYAEWQAERVNQKEPA